MKLLTTVSAALFMAASSVPAFAGPTADAATASCLADLGMSQQVCNCIGARAEEDLTEEQQTFFVAVIQNDKAAQTAAMGDMTVNEMMGVTDFMNAVIPQCGGQ